MNPVQIEIFLNTLHTINSKSIHTFRQIYDKQITNQKAILVIFDTLMRRQHFILADNKSGANFTCE